MQEARLYASPWAFVEPRNNIIVAQETGIPKKAMRLSLTKEL
jgi:hypothetical protein